MATKLKENCENKTKTPTEKKSASKKTTKTQKKENSRKTKADYESEIAMLASELNTINSKLSQLEKTNSQIIGICSQLIDMVKELNKRSNVLEEMAERTFVILKVLEGNQQKIIKLGLEAIARKNLRLNNKAFSIQEVVTGFFTTRTTIGRWIKGSKKNPDRKIRINYYIDSGKPYFIYKELLEDILNDKVPTKKSKDFLLECLDTMANKAKISDSISQSQEELPKEFYEL